jgi:hypothetical protein
MQVLTSTAKTRSYLRGAALTALSLFLLKGVYVLVEIIYNHTLLEFVGSHYLTEAQVENIEIFGRNLAATGLLVLCLPLLLALARRAGKNSIMVVLILTAMAAPLYFSAYKGQEMLIEHLASQSSVRARSDAYYLNMLRGLLARGDIVSSRYLPARSEGADLSFEDKLTLLTMPLALADERALIERLSKDGATATARFLREDALRSRFADDWEHYRTLQHTLGAMWESYKQAMTSAESALRTSNEDAAAMLLKLYKDAGRAYLEYESAGQIYNEVVNKRLSDESIRNTRQLLTDYFNAPADKRADKYLYQWATWNTYGNAVPEKEAHRWCSDNRRSCPGSLVHIRNVSRQVFLDAFKASNNGLPPGLTAEQFLRHRATTERIIVQLKERGINVPASFAKDASVLVRALRQHIADGATREWRSAWVDVGVGEVPAGLSVSLFIKHKGLLAALPEELRGKPLFLDMEGFFEKVWSPVAEKRIKEAQGRLIPESPEVFGEGHWMEVGTKSVKLMYVLPLAMTFSAVFSLLNLLSMVLVLVAWGYAATKGRALPRYVSPLVFAIVLLVLPYAASSTIDSEHAGVSMMVGYAEKEGPVVGAGIKRVVQAESLVYRMGAIAVGSLPASVQAQFVKLFGG